MRMINVVGICIAGIAATAGLAAYGAASAGHSPGTQAVADANGNLHVPDSYRTTYQSLGAWVVAADKGQGVKDLHVVYASPGAIAEYRKDGRFPDGTVLVKEVFTARTAQMTVECEVSLPLRRASARNPKQSHPLLALRWPPVVTSRSRPPQGEALRAVPRERTHLRSDSRNWWVGVSQPFPLQLRGTWPVVCYPGTSSSERWAVQARSSTRPRARMTLGISQAR